MTQSDHRASRSSPPIQWLGSAPALLSPEKANRAGAQVTKHSCRRKGSIAPTLRLVVKRRIPLELAHQLEQALLSSARDEFLQRLCDGGFLGALAADLEGPFDQLWIDREIRRHALHTQNETNNTAYAATWTRRSRHRSHVVEPALERRRLP